MSEKKFTIKGYVKGKDIPGLSEEADSLEEARKIARTAIEQTAIDRVTFWEEVKEGEKGIANTIQRNEKGEIEEIEGWWYGEEEEKTAF